MTSYGTFTPISEKDFVDASLGQWLFSIEKKHRLPKDICKIIAAYAVDYDSIQRVLKEEKELWKSAPLRMPCRVLVFNMTLIVLYVSCIVFLGVVSPALLILIIFGPLEMNCVIICCGMDAFYWIWCWYQFHQQRIEILNRASSMYQLTHCRYKTPSFCNLLCSSAIGERYDHSHTDDESRLVAVEIV
jgi:hypothetical protein